MSPEFLEEVRHMAEVKQLDFRSDPDAAETLINRWVALNTNGESRARTHTHTHTHTHTLVSTHMHTHPHTHIHKLLHSLSCE